MEEQEVKVSKYNSGIAQIYRMDNLWKDINNHSRQGLYSKWNEDLDRIWQELVADFKKQSSYVQKQEDLLKLDEELAKLGGFDDGGFGFNEVTKNQKEKRANQYKKLMEKEEFLRRLQNEVGKGTAWEDEQEDDW